MYQIATITSKNQLTIPAVLVREFGLTNGRKVLISKEDNAIKIIPALALVRKLAGSVRVPKRFRGLTPDEMIEKAKNEYFRRH